MSAYVVNNTTINRVIGYLSNQQRDCSHVFRDIMQAAELAHMPADWQTPLGITMLYMNQTAVNQRYKESEQPPMFEFAWENPNPIQAVKSLQCFLYQCAEGDVPEHPLYKALRKLEFWILYRIVSSLPAYDRAEWS